MKEHQGCHPCGTCEFFRKSVVKAVPWWEITDRQIDVIIPICLHAAHELAIGKCTNHEDSEFIKEMKEKGLIDEDKSDIENR